MLCLIYVCNKIARLCREQKQKVNKKKDNLINLYSDNFVGFREKLIENIPMHDVSKDLLKGSVRCRKMHSI